MLHANSFCNCIGSKYLFIDLSFENEYLLDKSPIYELQFEHFLYLIVYEYSTAMSPLRTLIKWYFDDTFAHFIGYLIITILFEEDRCYRILPKDNIMTC